MPCQLLSIPSLASFLFLSVVQTSLAGEVYQWMDEEGNIHIGNIPADDTATLVYAKTESDRAYRWSDENGGVHFSDTPPAVDAASEIRKIEINEFAERTDKANRYSIIRQAERMAQSRRQFEKKRLLEKQMRLEEQRIKEELEIIRLNELLRKQGYGQRPYGFPYAQVY